MALAVEPSQHPGDQAPVDGAQDRMLDCGVAEWAVLRDNPQLTGDSLGSGLEAM